MQRLVEDHRFETYQTDRIRPPRTARLLPASFATFAKEAGLGEHIENALRQLDPDDPNSLMVHSFDLRRKLRGASLPQDLSEELSCYYQELGQGEDVPCAVRSADKSFTALGTRVAHLPGLYKAVAAHYADYASGAVLNGRVSDTDELMEGAPELLLSAPLDPLDCSGVVLSFEPRSGNPDFLVVFSAWGLAEDIRRKELGRDEYLIHKPTLEQGFPSLVRRRCGHKEFQLRLDSQGGQLKHEAVPHDQVRRFTLSPEEALELARLALALEHDLGTPVSVEWSRTRSEQTLQPHSLWEEEPKPPAPVRVYKVTEHGPILAEGKPVGTAVALGRVRVVQSREQLELFAKGEVLVAPRTEPDWEPWFQHAAAIITEGDTRTSHATIMARELGIPGLLGCKDCCDRLKDGQQVTVSCCEGDRGFVYGGEAKVEVEDYDATHLPPTRIGLRASLSMPEQAAREACKPWAGAGLVRTEFLFTGWLKIHPLALLQPERLPAETRATVARLTRDYPDGREYMLDQLAQGVATIASAFYPRPVVVRLCDLKSDEYRNLLGGPLFEPEEAQPMLGWRGADRYLHPDYEEAFRTELQALHRVVHQMGLTNVELMVPFCRTPELGYEVRQLITEVGLGQAKVHVMAELPSNVLLAREFLEVFDGFSIGSNDLTQLVLGVDRNSQLVSDLFDETHPALMQCYKLLLESAHKVGKPVSFCGQIASADGEFVRMLAEMGLDSVSVTPDAFFPALRALTG